jgi:signal transduction histidine kinase/ActR/RegA family two-component response regulator
MKRIRDLTLSRKLTLIILSTTLLAMFASSWAIVHFQEEALKQGMVNELETTANILGANAAVALSFDVQKDGERILQSLAAKEQIRGGCFFRPDGTLFARYARTEPWEPHLPMPLMDGHSYGDSDLTLIKTIKHESEVIGVVHLQSDLNVLLAQREQALRSTLLSIFTFSSVALLFSFYLLRLVARPIRGLVDTANEVSDTQNYALRAEKFADDDLGILTARFNNMLEQIQRRDAELNETQIELEAKVIDLAEGKREVERAQARERDLLEKLSRSQRLESLGILAGGVAHDLNNILGPLVAYPELMMERVPESDTSLRQMVNRIDESAKKAAGVIRNLLTLGRRGNFTMEPMSINSLVDSYLRSSDYFELQRRYHQVELRQSLQRDVWPIEASVPHLNQVIMNLVINAYEAMPFGGHLLVETKQVSLTEPFEGYELIEPGQYSRIRVKDNGAGIAPGRLERIFEPFYTDKEMGRSGSGLGLAVVYGVVQDLRGRIDVQSEEGVGTQFDLYFPAVLNYSPPEPEPKPIVRGEQRVLVVDDVAVQREVAVALLGTLGYTVESVKNGHEALDFLARETVDLIVLDMIMEEGFDGLDTYREIAKLYPGQKCVIASGFSESERVKEAQALGAGGYVAKPYTRDGIGKLVRAELDRAPD